MDKISSISDNRIIMIDSLENPLIQYYVGSSEPQLLHAFEPESGVFIAETPMIVERALTKGYEPLSFLIDKETFISPHFDMIRKFKDIPVFVGENDIISKMVGYSLTRGMLCAMRRKPLDEVKEIIADKTRIAILENVMNPANIGAIFRSAAALGIEAIVLTKDCSDPFYRRALRVGMGAALQIPWTYVDDCEACFEILKDIGFKTVAMALEENSVSICDERIKQSEKLAVILGSEGYGLKDTTISKCDFTAMIPMYNDVDSLNVAAAGAVIFWELCKV